MDWNLIVSRNENLCEVYQSFNADLKKYIEKMRFYLTEIEGNVSSLSSAWNGPDYNEFKLSMNKATETVSNALDRGEKLADAMKEAEQKLATGLELLRTKL